MNIFKYDFGDVVQINEEGYKHIPDDVYEKGIIIEQLTNAIYDYKVYLFSLPQISNTLKVKEEELDLLLYAHEAGLMISKFQNMYIN